MIQASMPSMWSCKPNQFAYASSEKDLEKRFFLQLAALHPSTHKNFRQELHENILSELMKQGDK